MTTIAPHRPLATSTSTIASLALGGALALAVVVRGGFTESGRTGFALAAGGALLAALASGHLSRSAVRHPAVVGLALLAALSIASAAWTEGAPNDAVRAGLVVAGLAAMALAAASLAPRPGGRNVVVAAIVAVALVTGAVGYVAAAVRAEPLAQCLSGVWRPGGTFEYSPALGLAQVAALPILLRGAVSLSARLAAVATAAAALGAGVLVMTGSRTQLVLAAVVLLVALVWPARTVLAARGRLATVAGAIVAAALVMAVVSRTDALSGGTRIVVAVAIVGAVAYAGLWLALRLDPPSLVDAGRAGAESVARAWSPVHGVCREDSPSPHYKSGGCGGAPAGCILRVDPEPAWRRRSARIRAARGGGSRRRRPGRRGGAVVLACLAVGGGLTAMASTAPAECGTPPDGGLTHGRLALWGDAAATFAERPLLGAGAGAFLAASAERQGESPVRFAHSLPLEVGVELGVLGLGALALLVAGAGLALRRARGTPSLWLFGPAVVAFLAANLVDWSWQLPGVGAIFAVALGGLIAVGGRP